MKTHLKYAIIALAALLTVSLVVCGGLSIPAQAASSYYVDCSAGSNGDGSSGSPWNNLASVNATTFSAGDSILLKRGTTCHGQLHPLGSGVSGSPITIGAYGSGSLPIVDGDYAVNPVVKLYDQEYWEIENIEAKESTPPSRPTAAPLTLTTLPTTASTSTTMATTMRTFASPSMAARERTRRRTTSSATTSAPTTAARATWGPSGQAKYA